MLGGRTKQIHTYGKRSRRVVNACESRFEQKENSTVDLGAPALRQTRPENASIPISSGSSTTDDLADDSPQPKPVRHRRKKLTVNSPAGSPEFAVPNRTSSRPALACTSPNIPGTPSPRISRKPKRTSALKPTSPMVNVDIVLLSDEGQALNQERRVTRPNMSTRTTTAYPHSEISKLSLAVTPSIISVSEDEDGQKVSLSPLKPLSHSLPARRRSKVSTGEEFARPTIEPGSRIHVYSPPSHRALDSVGRSTRPNKAPRITHIVPKAAPAKHASSPSEQDYRPRSIVNLNRELTRAPRTSIIRPLVPQSPPLMRNRARQLTPIRNSRRNVYSPIPPSPTTSIDSFDLDHELQALELSSSSTSPELPAVEPYLQPLLAECSQEAPYEFSAFINTFPFDSIVNAQGHANPTFQKIGEASYSEVFGVGDVVLKIIPIQTPTLSLCDIETPLPSEAKDILREIVVTRAVGDACDGFTTLLRTYVVRGKYPSLLLQLWDEYNEYKGSESIRPDMFTASQVYAIIALPNGGSDLEAYTFAQPAKTGWRQAASIFWQIAGTLAAAEDAVAFEHRDLHWGQILVKDVYTKSTARAPTTSLSKRPLDSTSYGVETTIIDLGLARMDAGDSPDRVYWTPFDEEIFEGDGDYQYDIYRLMRYLHGDDWSDFQPLTNVMWLHYLCVKLLKSKGLRAPSKKVPSNDGSSFGERECYETLIEVQELLSRAIDTIKRSGKQKQARKATANSKKLDDPVPQTAEEVVQFGAKKGWILPVSLGGS